MNYFDMQYFSYGVGLVMMGWIIGTVVSFVFAVVKRIGLL